MERLPDIPDAERRSEYEKNKLARTGSSDKKQSKKDKLGTYGLLFIVLVMLFMITQKAEVPLDGITVTDCSFNDSKTTFFVAGELAEGNKFADSQVEFDESTGIVEVTLYKYATPSFIGTREFVAMVDTAGAEVKEVWLKSGTDKVQVPETAEATGTAEAAKAAKANETTGASEANETTGTSEATETA